MLLFIVNPVSSNGRGREVWKYVKQELKLEQVPYQVEVAKHSGHAKEITPNSIFHLIYKQLSSLVEMEPYMK